MVLGADSSDLGARRGGVCGRTYAVDRVAASRRGPVGDRDGIDQRGAMTPPLRVIRREHAVDALHRPYGRGNPRSGVGARENLDGLERPRADPGALELNQAGVGSALLAQRVGIGRAGLQLAGRDHECRQHDSGASRRDPPAAHDETRPCGPGAGGTGRSAATYNVTSAPSIHTATPGHGLIASNLSLSRVCSSSRS